MANQNQKAENKNVENEQVQNGTEQQPVVQPQQTETTEKKNFGGWLKQHWKGVVAGVTGALALGGSAVMAYRKGKAAGINMTPVPQEQDDYSLNPNE